MPLLSASISTAAGNSHKLAYFELSKGSVAAGLYKAAKSCCLISGVSFEITLMAFDS